MANIIPVQRILHFLRGWYASDIQFNLFVCSLFTFCLYIILLKYIFMFLLLILIIGFYNKVSVFFLKEKQLERVNRNTVILIFLIKTD